MTGVIDRLIAAIGGVVRADRLTRSLYATDASIYQIVPDAVVLPRSIADVAATVRVCREHGVPVTARGAGTGLTGGAINRGVIVDFSRYMNRILHVDAGRRIAVVEPGVVLDGLNAVLAPHGLHFAPDVATSNRATLGGMIANNSCGARSILYGRTVDHVLGLDVVLSDGSRHTWGVGACSASDGRSPVAGDNLIPQDAAGATAAGPTGIVADSAKPSPGSNLQRSTFARSVPGKPGWPTYHEAEYPRQQASATGGRRYIQTKDDLVQRCEETLLSVLRDCGEEIGRRFPKVGRSNAGYGLDRLRIEDGRVENPQALICGSEGTLCVVVGAVLQLTPLPPHKGLLVAHYEDLLAALEAAPLMLEHRPAAVELVDRAILDAAKRNPTMTRRRTFLQGEPDAILVVEMHDDRADRLAERLHALAADLQSRGCGYAWPVLTAPAAQADVWAVRKNGLGLQMSRPGDLQPHAFIEDTAVDPGHLRAYVERLQAIMKEEGIERIGCYAHAGSGCLHIRPVLNLTRREDVERMRRIADRVSSLVLEFGGTMTGEHGDGIVRSVWLEKLYGPRIVEAFGKIKAAFDPQGLFNPGKIVSPLPMTESLRYQPVAEDTVGDRIGVEHQERSGPSWASARADAAASFLDFSAYGGMAGLAGMCSGIGECRKRGTGTMCPSYMATGEEKDSTRGRANALRLALSDFELIQGLDDEALADVMDLCLSCKACKSECPTGVDMARLKAEWLAWRQQRLGVPRRSQLVAATPRLAAWGCRFAPMSNWLMQSRPARWLLQRFFGLDRRIPPPRFARRTFRSWFAAHRRGRVESGRERGHHHQDVRREVAQDEVVCREVVYFVDTWTNYYTPQVGVATVKVLEALGYDVLVPPTVCCGRPAISKGLLSEARRLAERNIAVLSSHAERGTPIVGTEPSCLLTLVDEYPQLVRSASAKKVARQAVLLETFVAAILNQRPDALRIPSDARRALYHGHCHQKALVGTSDALRVLNVAACGGAREIDSGCCGMAGSFGHEAEHYDVARAIGEQRLFPAVRRRGNADVVVSGFSCRHQIEHHTGVTPLHIAEYLAACLCDAGD